MEDSSKIIIACALIIISFAVLWYVLRVQHKLNYYPLVTKRRFVNAIMFLPDAVSAQCQLATIFDEEEFEINMTIFRFSLVKNKTKQEVNEFFEVFFDCCESADIVILHDWLPALPIDHFSSKLGKYFPNSKTDKFSTPIKTPEKGIFRGQQEMACLAWHLRSIARQVRVYSLVFGGSFLAPVHKSAEVIYSFHDPIMLRFNEQGEAV